MASASFPALAINTQGESPLNMLAKVEQIKASQQSQEMGSIQLQNARLQQQSNAVIMKAIADHQGNLDEAIAQAKSTGQALPNDILGLQEKSVALQTAMYKKSEAQLAVTSRENELVTNAMDAIKPLPIEQRGAAILKAAGDLGTQGIDISKYTDQIKALMANPTDEAFKQWDTVHMGVIWAANKAKAEYEEQTRQPAAEVRQTQALQLQKLSTEALQAQRNFENTPTPLEASTKRAADLLLERSEIAKNQVETAKTRFDMYVKQNEPVEGTNANNVRVVVPRAESKGLTSVNDLSSQDYDKLSMLSARFGQVAQNYGKLEAAIRQGGQIQHRDDMAQVIADQGLGDEAGFLHAIPSGKMLASKEVSKATADSWNKLTSEERNMAMAYLQVKGGIITYNKAVDDTGRANETALHLEAANIPTPLEDKNVALSRIQGNKDNLRTILPAIPHFSHLPDPLQYLQAGENVPITSPQQQPRNTNAFGYQPPPTQR